MKKWKEVSEDERSLQDCHADPHSQRLELSLSPLLFNCLPSLPRPRHSTPPPSQSTNATMLASTRMSTAQRPAAAARALAASSKANVTPAAAAAARGVSAAAARRSSSSSPLICRAEPGEEFIFFSSLFSMCGRQGPFSSCRTRGVNWKMLRGERRRRGTLEKSRAKEKADRNSR